MRTLFGELLAEIQRIKSTGDFEAARKLVETYGVHIDYDIPKDTMQLPMNLVCLESLFAFYQASLMLDLSRQQIQDIFYYNAIRLLGLEA